MPINRLSAATEQEAALKNFRSNLTGLHTLIQRLVTEENWAPPALPQEDGTEAGMRLLDHTAFPAFVERLRAGTSIAKCATLNVIGEMYRLPDVTDLGTMPEYLTFCHVSYNNLAREISERAKRGPGSMREEWSFFFGAYNQMRILFLGLGFLVKPNPLFATVTTASAASQVQQSVTTRVGELGGQVAGGTNTEADKQ